MLEKDLTIRYMKYRLSKDRYDFLQNSKVKVFSSNTHNHPILAEYSHMQSHDCAAVHNAVYYNGRFLNQISPINEQYTLDGVISMNNVSLYLIQQYYDFVVRYKCILYGIDDIMNSYLDLVPLDYSQAAIKLIKL